MALPDLMARRAGFKRAVIDVEGIGQVHLRSPSARAAMAMKELSLKDGGEGSLERLKSLELALRSSVCDPAGELLFADEKLDPLEYFTVEQAGPVYLKALELMTGKSAAELEKIGREQAGEGSPKGNSQSSSS